MIICLAHRRCGLGRSARDGRRVHRSSREAPRRRWIAAHRLRFKQTWSPEVCIRSAGLTTSGVGPGAGIGGLRSLICAPSVGPGVVFGSELSLLCGNPNASDKAPIPGDRCGFRSRRDAQFREQSGDVMVNRLGRYEEALGNLGVG